MKLSVKFFQTTFEGSTGKEAYARLCRWLGKNVISKVEMSDVTYNISKVEDANLPTFKLELYGTLEEGEFRKSTCERCKEFHSLFYMNQQYNCDACNMMAYIKQGEQKLRVKKHFKKEQLNRILEMDGE